MRLTVNIILKYFLKSRNELELTYSRWMNNRIKKLSNKEKFFYLNVCPLPKLPPTVHLPKLICLATPGMLNALVFLLCHIFCLL